MTVKKAVRRVASGYNYRVHFGRVEFRDDNGNVGKTPPSRIIGGWALTEREAERKADEVIAAYAPE